MTRSNDDSDPGAKAYRGFRVDLTQDEFDLEFFGQILENSDDNLDVLRRQAELLARSGDYESALALDRRLVERCPRDPVVLYNFACSLSMTGQASAAIDILERAIARGYSDFAHIEADADLDPVRDLPGFHELMRRRLTDDDVQII